MSLSQEPANTALKKYFVCGVKDITDEPYCGMSGSHGNFGNAVTTTNGAGAHNIQLFMMDPDGTVLNVLPGYWNPQDLVYEMQFASQLDQVWQNQKLSKGQKDTMFAQMHMEHIAQHPRSMAQRSHLQGFDAKFEADHRLATTDTIKNRQLAMQYASSGQHVPMQLFKTTDEIMHERVAKQPFVNYTNFDVVSFSDYGLQKYDKHEDALMSNGMVDHEKAASIGTIGKAKPMGENNASTDSKEWGSAARPWGAE